MTLSFQSLILRLQHFWADQGCVVWQPYYSQVGAGTMNPATALRVLGPEPWNVAYVEPSIRPDDGRYGENPNRLQQHYQFQVILKPDPGNPQEIYLRSLEAIGIDPLQHDIRFVEDNWESPALGAWGLGWEVWCDGQEITQFTYFQQAGGQLCDPVSVEITYGLDRIAIALQRVHGFTEIQWNDPLAGQQAITSGDVNLQGEQEHSKYYFEIADVERMRRMYDLYAAEAKACLEQGLVLPAHDYVLKLSHTFNVLDTRGAIGVTERAAFFASMRDLSRRVAETYLEQRQRLEYPFLKENGEKRTESRGRSAEGGTLEIAPVTQPQTLLVEIGSEELPAADLEAALEQLRARLPALLVELRLTHGAVRVDGTPRRLVVYVEEVSPRQPDLEQVVKGPPADRAFDTLGQPTKAAEGFARGKGLSVSDLQIREMDGGRYVSAVVLQPGRPAVVALAESLPGLIAALKFDKSMRWNHSNTAFSRPIRWLLALYGEQTLSFEYAGLCSGNVTRGLRFHEPEEFAVNSAAEYFSALADQGILLDAAERRSAIQTQVKALAAEVGGVIPEDPALLAEVANLVEAPTALRGSFDPVHLKLPREVLISVMKKHQRYFPVTNLAGAQLLPYFIAVRNGDHQGLDLVIEGNEHVIRARFADADFFVRDDVRRKLEDFLPRLGTLTFQVKLGSMLDKSRRVAELTRSLAPILLLSPEEGAAAQRAAELCKADLATRMVVEMTSLQGIMGRYYALQSGESEAVAKAISEHYLPRFTGDNLPESNEGFILNIADNIDSLTGLFAVGLAPTGNKDPFALRRSALSIVINLQHKNRSFDLRYAIDRASELLPVKISDEQKRECLAFITERLRNMMLGYHRYDVINAVLAVHAHDPATAWNSVLALSTNWINRPDWHTILPAYARCVRIVRSAVSGQRSAVSDQLDLQTLAEPAEIALYAALQTAEDALRNTQHGIDSFLETFLPLIPAINRFFDEVLVMAEEPAVRQNRLALVQRIAALADGVADFSKLEGF